MESSAVEEERQERVQRTAPPRSLVLTKCAIKSTGHVPPPRFGHTLSLVGHELFVFGGGSGSGSGSGKDQGKDQSILGDMVVCQIGSSKWERVECGGQAPGPLYGHTAAVETSGGRVYVFGGVTMSNTYLFDGQAESTSSTSAAARFRHPFQTHDEETTNNLFVFDTESRMWSRPAIDGTPPSPRYHHSSCFLGSYLLIFGGCAGGSYKKALNDLHVLDTVKQSWFVPKMSGELPPPQYGHTATAVEGVYARTLLDYCMMEGTREEKAREAKGSSGRPEEQPRHRQKQDSQPHARCMLLFGGANEDMEAEPSPAGDRPHEIGRFNDIYVLDIDTWTWYKPTFAGTPPLARYFHSAGLVGDLLYVFGGDSGHDVSDMCVLRLGMQSDAFRWIRPLYDGSFEHFLHASEVVYNKLMVFGGATSSRGITNDFFFLNVVSIDPTQPNEFTFKLVLAGDVNVGKSCLTTRFAEDRFNDMHISTIGVDFKTVTTILRGKVVKLHVWDTAGQERFAQVTRHYYRGADGAVLVYDTTNMESFHHIAHWLEAIEGSNPVGVDGKPILKLLVGNKCDLATKYRQVESKDGREFAKRIKATFVETSAKNAFNVDTAFLALAKRLVDQRIKAGVRGSENSRGSRPAVKLGGSAPAQSRFESCCK